jgi:hypothetical protein
MMAKHWVSVLDIIDKLVTNNYVSGELIDEKIGDSINYLILLEAMLIEITGYEITKNDNIG